MPQTFFLNFFYSQKDDLIRLTTYHWQPCILQFCDITKSRYVENPLQTKKRDYELIAVSSLTKSEYFATATSTFRPRFPVVIYKLRLLRCHKVGKTTALPPAIFLAVNNK